MIKAFIAVIGMFFLFPGGLSAATVQEREARFVFLEDSLGKTVKIKLPVKRIVALNSNVLEVIRALDAADFVVGVFTEITRSGLFWKDLSDKPKVGSWREVNMELIVDLAPDIVIAYERNPGPELENKLEPFGIKVLRLNFYKINTLEKEIRNLGRILDKEDEANRLCTWYETNFKLIRERLEKKSQKPDVYVESYSDYHAGGPGSGSNEMCLLAGARNISSEFAIPYPEVTPEWVVAKNPHIIIKGASFCNGYEQKTFADFNAVRKSIMERPAWNHIDAVMTGRVHVMDSGIWTGPRAIIGVSYLAKWFYPDLFADFDPESIHREYLQQFQTIPYQGVFVSNEGVER
jgi:iron complex transport system substrate-binding protein